MNTLDLLTYYVIPITGALLLSLGMVAWQRSERFWSGQHLAPRPWQTAVILVGTAALIVYIAFVVPYDSSALRFMTMLLISTPAAGAVWLTRLSRRQSKPDQQSETTRKGANVDDGARTATWRTPDADRTVAGQLPVLELAERLGWRVEWAPTSGRGRFVCDTTDLYVAFRLGTSTDSLGRPWLLDYAFVHNDTTQYADLLVDHGSDGLTSEEQVARVHEFLSEHGPQGSDVPQQ